MKSDRLQVALVGAAGQNAGHCHLNALPAVPRVDLAAVCDVDTAAVEPICRQHRISKVYSDYSELLADPQIDAVDLVVPPFLHAEMAIAAARAGKHVYVEKPMARSFGEGCSMVAAAQQARVKLMVGESYWFHGPHVLARRLIDDGEIGDVVQVRMTKDIWVFKDEENERLGGRGHDATWRFDPDLSGGGDFPFFMDHGSHLFATARLLAGGRDIAWVTALPRDHGYGREKHLRGITAVSWAYVGGEADGVWTQVETPPEAGRYIGFRSEVTGTCGSMLIFGEGGGSALGFPQVTPVTVYRNGQIFEHDPNEGLDRTWQSNNSYYDQAHINSLTEFVSAVLDDRPLSYDGHSGLLDLSTTLAVLRSATEMRPIQANDVADDWRPKKHT